MPTLYDRADIYDLIENEERYGWYKRHWEHLLQDADIHSLLDVSIGSGSVTLPLAQLGVALSGSDLSEAMLKNCAKKAEARGFDLELKRSDFRDLSCWQGRQFDCVASTGNSLAYVANDEIPGVLARMDALVKPGGHLYFDTRNWDAILETRQRFYLYNPFFHGEDRVNLVQVWDYPADGSVVFNLLYTFERECRIFQKETFEERYHPIPRQLLLDALAGLGYRDVKQFPFPAFADRDPEQAEWYCVLAPLSLSLLLCQQHSCIHIGSSVAGVWRQRHILPHLFCRPAGRNTQFPKVAAGQKRVARIPLPFRAHYPKAEWVPPIRVYEQTVYAVY